MSPTQEDPYNPRGEPGTTLSVRRHDVPADRAPHGGRHVALGPVSRRAAAGDVLRGVARARARKRGLEHGGWATIYTARSAIEARVLVTDRIAAADRARARRRIRSACRTTGAQRLLTTGDSANDLPHMALDPNVHIQEVKAATCGIRPGRRPRGRGAARSSSRRCASRRSRMSAPPAGRRTATSAASASASSPTRRSASAARRARSRARSGTSSRRTASSWTGESYDNTSALGANTWRHVAFIEQQKPLRRRRATADAACAG